jgi:SpoVK/Ycf46/Vps4 family AAA+-type ATPase
LISGENKCGKTVLALKTAFDSKVKNIKVIRAIDLISFDEIGKANYIADLVKNAYIAEDSLIVIDDIEIAINYAQIGNNTVFSNRLYQILITILKTEPIQPNHKIFFICTSRLNELFKEAKLFDLIWQCG